MNSTFRLLRALTRTMQKCEWRIAFFNGIRVKYSDEQCPLVFAEKVATGKSRGFYSEAGKALGFSIDLSERIAEAADATWNHDPQLRRILLKAARLK